MGQIPNAHVLLVEYFIFLVVANHVLLNQSIVNDSWLDCFCIFFDLTFGLELITDVRLHFLN